MTPLEEFTAEIAGIDPFIENYDAVIRSRRKSFIQSRIQQFETVRARSQAQAFYDTQIPDVVSDPIFQQALTAQASAAEPDTAQSRAAAISQDGVREGSFVRGTLDTVQTGLVSTASGVLQGAGSLLEAASRQSQKIAPAILSSAKAVGDVAQGEIGFGEIKGQVGSEVDAFLDQSPTVRLAEGVQRFGRRFQEDNLSENTIALKERNARIGQEQGLGSQIANFVTTPQLVADLAGFSAGFALGSGGPAGGVRSASAKVVGATNVGKMKAFGEKLKDLIPGPDFVRDASLSVARNAPTAGRVGLAVGETTGEEAYQTTKESLRENGEWNPDYLLTRDLLRKTRGAEPSHEEVTEIVSRKTERIAAKYGSGAAIVAMSLPGGFLLERTFSKLPGRLLGAATGQRSVNTLTARKAQAGDTAKRILGGVAGEGLSEGLEEAGQVAAQEAAIRSLVSGEVDIKSAAGSEETVRAGLLGASLGALLGGGVSLLNTKKKLDTEMTKERQAGLDALEGAPKERALARTITRINEAYSNVPDLPLEQQAALVAQEARQFAEDIGLTNVESVINDAAYTSRGVTIPEKGRLIADEEVTIEETPEVMAEAERQDEDVKRGVQFVHDAHAETVSIASGVDLPASPRFGSGPHHAWTDSIETDVLFSSDEFAFADAGENGLVKVFPSGRSEPADQTDAQTLAIGFGVDSFQNPVQAEPIVTPDNVIAGNSPVEIQSSPDGTPEVISYQGSVATLGEGGYSVTSTPNGIEGQITSDPVFAQQVTKVVGDDNFRYKIEALNAEEFAGVDALTQGRQMVAYQVPLEPTEGTLERKRQVQSEALSATSETRRQLEEEQQPANEEERRALRDSNLMAAASTQGPSITPYNASETVAGKELTKKGAYGALNTNGNRIEFFERVEDIQDEVLRSRLTGPISIVSHEGNNRVIVLTNGFKTAAEVKRAYANEAASHFTMQNIIGPVATESVFGDLRIRKNKGKGLTRAFTEADKDNGDSTSAERAVAGALGNMTVPPSEFVNWVIQDVKPRLVQAGWVAPDASFEEVAPFVVPIPTPNGSETTAIGQAGIAQARGGEIRGTVEPERSALLSVFGFRGETNGSLIKQGFESAKTAGQVGYFILKNRGAIPAVKFLQWFWGPQYQVDMMAADLDNRGISNSLSHEFGTHHNKVGLAISEELDTHWRPAEVALDQAHANGVWKDKEDVLADYDLYAVALHTAERNEKFFLTKVPLKSTDARRAQKDIINQVGQGTLSGFEAVEQLKEVVTDAAVDIAAARKKFKLVGSDKAQVLSYVKRLAGQENHEAQSTLDLLTEAGKVELLENIHSSVKAATDRSYELNQASGLNGQFMNRIIKELYGFQNYITFRDGVVDPDQQTDSTFLSGYGKGDLMGSLGQAKGRGSIARGVFRATQDVLARSTARAEQQVFMRDLFGTLLSNQDTVDIYGLEVSDIKQPRFNNSDGDLPRISIPDLDSVTTEQFVLWRDGEAKIISVKDPNLVFVLRELYRPTDQKESYGFERSPVGRFAVAAGSIPGVKQGTKVIASGLTRLMPFFWPLDYQRQVRQVATITATRDVGSAGAGLKVMRDSLTFKSSGDLWKLLNKSGSDFAAQVKELEGGDQRQKYMAEWVRNQGVSTFAARQSQVRTQDPASLISVENQIQVATDRRKRNPFFALADAASNVTNVYDNIPRFSAYVALRESGVSPEVAAAHSINQTNFGQTSQVARNFGDSYAFANSAIAGSYSNFGTLFWKDGKAPVKFMQHNGKTIPVMRPEDVLKNTNKAAVAVFAGSAAISYGIWRSLLGDDEEAGKYKNRDFTNSFPIARVNSVLSLGERFDEVDFKQPTQFGMDQFWSFLGVMGMRVAMGDTSIESASDAVAQIAPLLTDITLSSSSPLSGLNSRLILPGETGEYRPAVDTLLAFAPTVFDPLVRTFANRNAFGGPVRPTPGFDFETRSRVSAADTSFFSTPREYQDFARTVREASGDIIDMNPEVYKFWLQSYGGAFGRAITDVTKHASARSYAPATSGLILPTSKARYYYEVGYRSEQHHRMNSQYGKTFNKIKASEGKAAKEAFARKNPGFERARRILVLNANREDAYRKEIEAMEDGPRTPAMEARRLDIMDEIRALAERTAIEMQISMDEQGEVNR